MSRVGTKEFLGPLEPLLRVAVFHHPPGDLEASGKIAGVFEHLVSKLDDLIVLLAQPRSGGELSPRLFLITGKLERLGV